MPTELLGIIVLVLQIAMALLALYVLYKFRVKSRGRARQLITGGAVAGILLPMIFGAMQPQGAVVLAYCIVVLSTLGYVCILLGLLQFLRDVDVPEVD